MLSLPHQGDEEAGLDYIMLLSAYLQQPIVWVSLRIFVVCLKDEEKRTPLHFAADRGRPAIISTLLSLGAALDPQDADGMTPLAYAVACGNEEEIEVLVRRSKKCMPERNQAMKAQPVFFLLYVFSVFRRVWSNRSPWGGIC